MKTWSVASISATLLALLLGPTACAPRDNLHTHQFSASKTHFLLVQELERNREVVVSYDPAKKDLRVFGKRSTFLSGPRANGAGTAFYIAATDPLEPAQLQAGRKGRTILHRCGYAADGCAPVFQFEGAIGSPIDLDDGAMLFISAMPKIAVYPMAPDRQRVVYAGREFYRRDRGGAIHRLTEWRSGELQAASLAGDRLVFQFRPVPKNVPPEATSPQRTSHIYEAHFSSGAGIAGFEQRTSQPFIDYGKQYDTAPSLSPDGSRTAFSSASDGANGRWRYDIVVFDNRTKRELHTVRPEPGTTFTPPVFVDQDTVAFASFDGSAFVFRHLDVPTRHETVLGRLSSAEIRAARIIELDDGSGGG